MNRLMLCAGMTKRAGWKTLDCKPGHDFVATIPPLPAEVKAIVWDEIEWIHGITSLYLWEARDVLPEILGCMAPGGKLILEQPDASKCDPVMLPQWLFGDPELRDPSHTNKWAYVPMGLAELLREVGFGRIEILPAQHHVPARDFRVEAYR